MFSRNFVLKMGVCCWNCAFTGAYKRTISFHMVALLKFNEIIYKTRMIKECLFIYFLCSALSVLVREKRITIR